MWLEEMNKLNHFGPWPEAVIEVMDACPICQSAQCELLHEGVRDWSFFSAPSSWSYWRCHDCGGVYLNPRPKIEAIWHAYASYYTHVGVASGLGWRRLKARWRNERLSARFGRNINSCLKLPNFLGSFVSRKAERMDLVFGWQELADLKPGELMDVGCGAGVTLALARQLGWRVHGLEMDSAAVQAARDDGIDVLQGSFERLEEFKDAFDAIICSHVIEHVFDPLEMIRLMHAALRPGGVLLVATPNARSDVHHHFGKYWRGLEAPRHLILFTESTLKSILMRAGF